MANLGPLVARKLTKDGGANRFLPIIEEYVFNCYKILHAVLSNLSS